MSSSVRRVASRLAVFSLVLLVPLTTHAERMSFLHTPPPTARAGGDLEIMGNIVGADDLAKARCRYRVRGGPWKQVQLGLEYGDLYRAVIPGAHVKAPSMEYYCVGFDYFGGQKALFRSASEPGVVKVIGEGGAEDPEPGKDPEVEAKPEPEAPKAKVEEAPLMSGEDIVTIATGQAQTISAAPAMASGVPADQISALGLRLLPDVLKIIPGFETSRDVQGFHRVAVRGIRDEASLLVLYDGHRLNNAYDARALLEVPVFNLERVEAIRGPGSALYGTGAFVGVVNVVPKRREGIELTASGGSFGSAGGHLSAGARLGSSDWYAYADADYVRSDGYRREIELDALSRQMEGAGRKSDQMPAGITNDSGDLVNVGAEIRRSPEGGGQTRLHGRFLRQDRAALVGLFDVVGADSNLGWTIILADLSHELTFSSGSVVARAFFDRQQVDRRFQVAPSGYPLTPTITAVDGLFERTRFTTQSAGGEVGLDLTLAQSHRLSVGLSGTLSQLPAFSYEVNYEPGKLLGSMRQPTGFEPLQNCSELQSRIEAGAFAQDGWRALPSLSLTLGLRADVTQLPSTELDSGSGCPLSGGTRYVPSLNPRFGLVWTPTDAIGFKLLYGRAFRAPTLQELSDKPPVPDLSQGRFEGNPGLTPALIDTLEAGVEATAVAGESKLRLRANGFLNLFTDPIMAIDTSGNIIPLSNRKLGVRVWGAEAELRLEVTSRANTFLNASWMRAVDLAAPEGFQVLTDVPQYRFNWAAQLPIGSLYDYSVLAPLGAERRTTGRSQLEALRRFRIPAYALVGAQLKTEAVADWLDLALSAHNIFQYDLKDDVPRPDQTRMPGLLPREGFAAYLTAHADF